MNTLVGIFLLFAPLTVTQSDFYIDSSISNTLTQVAFSQDEILEALDAVILERNIDTYEIGIEYELGKEPQTKVISKGTVELKIHFTGLNMEEPEIFTFDETITISDKVVYELKIKENDYFNNLKFTVEIVANGEKTKGSIKSIVSLKDENIRQSLIRLFSRLNSYKIKKAIKQISEPPKEEQVDNNQEPETDRGNTEELQTSG